LTRFISKKEFIFVICLAFIAAVTLLAMRFLSRPATAAQVTFDGSVVEVINLEEDAVYHISALYPVTLQTNDGAIRFIDSVCPNHDCEGFGWISATHEAAVCLPAKVAVQIIDRK